MLYIVFLFDFNYFCNSLTLLYLALGRKILVIIGNFLNLFGKLFGR